MKKSDFHSAFSVVMGAQCAEWCNMTASTQRKIAESGSVETDMIDRVRDGLLGGLDLLATPFGDRPMLYADYTASGRALQQVEDQIQRLSALYANPHTEDSETGRASGAWLREAEAVIKSAVNAGPEDCIIACGSGATGAVHKLQEILGLSVPPASRDRMLKTLGAVLGARGEEAACAALKAECPVVFIGPYEHHSNELSWRESLAEVVPVELAADGGIDYADLASKLADPRYASRRKIGAFSAASNVTGVKTDTVRLARLLHKHDAILCLDCAASAPYLQIDMHPAGGPEAAIDVVYFSPHKFVGGPGAAGVLIFNENLYRSDLPPTQSAGGTVRYVWKTGHDFIEGTEARERAGTPGVPQVVRAALAMKLQAQIGFDVITQREHDAMNRAFLAWGNNPHIDILGPVDPERRIGIVSFNIRDPRGDILHPRLVTVLLNDLFGIQSRAGCSCAGPYGHHLLNIDDDQTLKIRDAVLDGNSGMRPGWCRVSLHWLMSDDEVSYLIDAVRFLADHGWRFMSHYRFNPVSGEWAFRERRERRRSLFPEDVLASAVPALKPSAARRSDAFRTAIDAAHDLVKELDSATKQETGCLCEDLEPVRYFSLPR